MINLWAKFISTLVILLLYLNRRSITSLEGRQYWFATIAEILLELNRVVLARSSSSGVTESKYWTQIRLQQPVPFIIIIHSALRITIIRLLCVVLLILSQQNIFNGGNIYQQFIGLKKRKKFAKTVTTVVSLTLKNFSITFTQEKFNPSLKISTIPAIFSCIAKG